jgi:putative DNA modification/repair radical SAM protein
MADDQCFPLDGACGGAYFASWKAVGSGMDTQKKLEILSDAAKYDVSCASSGSRRANSQGGMGNTSRGGICHSWTDDGRCVSLLKILLSNACVYDCAYCINRCSNLLPRATFTVEEVVSLTMNFYRRNYIEGLFLSSAVFVSPNHTMERLLRIVQELREVHSFNGYIHLKAIPGADMQLIDAAGRCVDRMSVNIELPSEQSLKRLAPEKKKGEILTPMRRIHGRIDQNRQERRKSRKVGRFVPAGQSTQLIVGASPEADGHILRLSEGLYQHYGLKRVYYSAYIAVNEDSRLPGEQPALQREHRLYQADWLVRLYGFSASELLEGDETNLDPDLDPKAVWALRHPEMFPVEVNRADYETLLRVPGIGFTSAKRIVQSRRFGTIHLEDLKRFGVVLKRARYFLTCEGRIEMPLFERPALLRAALLKPSSAKKRARGEQLLLFS